MEQPMETRPGVPQNGGNGLVFDRPCSKRDPVHREGCGVPQNGTSRDTLHLHRRPPPASTGYRRPPPASTGSCSSSLHGLLFIQPPPRATPPATVHPALHGVVLFIQRQCHGVLFIHPHRSLFIQTPRNTHCSSHRSASVSSSSEGIARSGSVNSHRSIARVQ